ncbi:MAG: hypothetical protein ACRD0K_07580 [Egibacteraceae bacterium]
MTPTQGSAVVTIASYGAYTRHPRSRRLAVRPWVSRRGRRSSPRALRFVEEITERRRYPRAALGGSGTGALIGL